jgi:hypothetical protein
MSLSSACCRAFGPNHSCAHRLFMGALVAGCLFAANGAADATTSVSGVYQVQAHGTCALHATTCSMVFPALPGSNALAVHTVSCSISLDYDSAFITLPVEILSLKVASNAPDAGLYLAPQQLSFRQTGSNSSGQVSGVFTFAANFSGQSFITAGKRPTATLTLDSIQASTGLTSGTLLCTVSGQLISP